MDRADQRGQLPPPRDHLPLRCQATLETQAGHMLLQRLPCNLLHHQIEVIPFLHHVQHGWKARIWRQLGEHISFVTYAVAGIATIARRGRTPPPALEYDVTRGYRIHREIDAAPRRSRQGAHAQIPAADEQVRPFGPLDHTRRLKRVRRPRRREEVWKAAVRHQFTAGRLDRRHDLAQRRLDPARMEAAVPIGDEAPRPQSTVCGHGRSIQTPRRLIQGDSQTHRLLVVTRIDRDELPHLRRAKIADVEASQHMGRRRDLEACPSREEDRQRAAQHLLGRHHGRRDVQLPSLCRCVTAGVGHVDPRLPRVRRLRDSPTGAHRIVR
jgi:hypothetical protein